MNKNIQKQLRIAQKTLAIKARVYNQIRTNLYNKKLEQITEKEKVELFNIWFNLNQEAHSELNNYKSKRKEKARIQKLREVKLNS